MLRCSQISHCFVTLLLKSLQLIVSHLTEELLSVSFPDLHRAIFICNIANKCMYVLVHVCGRIHTYLVDLQCSVSFVLASKNVKLHRMVAKASARIVVLKLTSSIASIEVSDTQGIKQWVIGNHLYPVIKLVCDCHVEKLFV